MHRKNNDTQIKNQSFHCWTAIENIGYKGKSLYWLCRCKCGTERHIKQSELLSRKYKQCLSCHNKEVGIKNLKARSRIWNGYKEIHGNFWRSIVNSARKRNIKFEITIEDVWNQFEIQNGICALSGLKLQFAPSIKQQKELCTASLDRKDSSKGYSTDNIQWVHKMVQKMKNNYEEKEFIKMCKLIARYTC